MSLGPTRPLLVFASLLAAAACRTPLHEGGGAASLEAHEVHAEEGSVAAAGQPRYGQVMAEVGRRFELLGRAAAANRWELASYELDELDEAIEELATARRPQKVGEVDLHSLEQAFENTHVAELRAAVEHRDRAALEAAFDDASATCNGCHEQAKHAFIVVTHVPGGAVPALDPLP